MKNFFNPGSFARRAAIAAFSRLGVLWRSRARMTALLLIAALLTNAIGQETTPKPRPAAALEGVGLKAKATLATAAVVGAVAVIGVGVYVAIQRAHTVTGCVTDDPNVLLLHTGDGKTYVLLGATTNIKADTKIRVRGTKRKTIPGVIDQPSFVVEKLNKTYGSCSVTPTTP